LTAAPCHVFDVICDRTLASRSLSCALSQITDRLRASALPGLTRRLTILLKPILRLSQSLEGSLILRNRVARAVARRSLRTLHFIRCLIQLPADILQLLITTFT
jgi:hypothetical protein